MQRILNTLGAAVLLLLSTNAMAWHIAGHVYCDSNLNGVFDEGDVPIEGATVRISRDDGQTLFGDTNADGSYYIDIYPVLFEDSPGEWTVEIIAGLNPGAVPIPGLRVELLTPRDATPRILAVDDADFAVDDPACRPEEEGLCWMTAGGVKFEPQVADPLATKGPKDSFGGNVYPSCDSDPGQGGQWNHIAHSVKLHIMGTAVNVVRCGNVGPPVDDGSESPVTPFNYIEYEGIGWTQGIKGNKQGREPMTFVARVEDRNEPGNESATDGENIDRYYIRVTNGGGEVVYQLGTNDDPVTITGGNLQLHASSCDN